MMNKLIAVLLAALCALGLMMPALAEEDVSDALLFKREHEQLNGQPTLDGAHEYAALDIPEDNPFVYAEMDDITALLTDGNGVIYFGFPECPWCRTLLPVLVEALQEAEYPGTVWYYNCLAERDSKYLDDDGNIVTEDEGSENYARLLELLGDYFWEYQGLNDPTIKRLYFPTLVFVRGGEVQSVHIDTIEGQASGWDPLTEEQHDQLLQILVEGLNSTLAE